MFLFDKLIDLNGFVFENKNENMKVLRYGNSHWRNPQRENYPPVKHMMEYQI